MRRAIVLIPAVLLGFLFAARWTVLIAPYHQMEYPSEFVALVFRKTVVLLVLPLLAAVPGVIPLLPQVRNRYLVATRTRRPLRGTLVRMYGFVMATTFVALAGGTLIVILTAEFADIPYQPPLPGTTIELESQMFTFSQFISVGRGWFYLFLCTWLGLHGAFYAALGLSCILVIRNAVVGLLVPLILFTVGAYVMAALDLAAVSPYTALPFNMIQLPLWQPMVPFSVLVLLAVGSACLVVRHGDRLAKAQ